MRGLSTVRFGWWVGPMLRTHWAGKGSGRFGGCGLGSTEQKAPRNASRLWSQRVRDPTWEPSSLPGLEWVGQKPSAPLLLLWSWRSPPTCLSGSPQPPSYAPRAHAAWRGLCRLGDRPGSSAGSPGHKEKYYNIIVCSKRLFTNVKIF